MTATTGNLLGAIVYRRREETEGKVETRDLESVTSRETLIWRRNGYKLVALTI